jgi:hypothetical protein
VARLVFERFLPAARSEQDGLGIFAGRLARDGTAYAAPRRAFGRGAIGGAVVVLLAAAVVAAGIPARGPVQEATAAAGPPPITVHVDPGTLPRVSVDPAVADVSRRLAGPDAQELAATLAENLQVENEAIANADPRLLTAVDYGSRLAEMQRRIDDSVATGTTIVGHYVFDSLHLVTIPRQGQVALSLGIEARGSLEQTTYDSNGDRTGRSTHPFALTFVVSQPVGDRWLIVDTLPLP